MSTAGSIFASRAFSLFYAGQVFSYLGYGLRLVALPLLVYHLTGSAAALGVTYALELLPFAFFGPVAGSLADRLDRRTLMIGAEAVRCAIFVLFAIAYATHMFSLPWLYAGIALESLCAAAFISCQSSSIPYLLGKARTTQAVAALVGAEQSAIMVLPPVGAALFATLGPLPALSATALAYFVSLLSIAAVDTFGPDEPDGLRGVHDVRADIATGFRFLFGDPCMRAMALSSCGLNLFGFMAGAAFIPFFKHDLGASDLAIGYMFGFSALGSVAGSFAASKIRPEHPFGRIVTIALIGDGVLFLPVMFAQSFTVAVTFLAVTNAVAAFQFAQIVGWRMRVTPEDLVGRVMGASRLVALSGTVPGAVLGGTLADHFGARLPVEISGWGYFVLALIIASLPVIRAERR